MRRQLATVVAPLPDLATRIERYLDLKATVARLEMQLEEAKADLKAEAFAAHKEGRTLETETHVVAYVESESVHVSKDKLLELGVKPSIVAKATKITPYAYPRVIEKKAARLEREAAARAETAARL